MNVILFEDDKVAQLYPATIGRPALEVSCGSYRLVELADRLGDRVRTLVRPHLRQALQADLPELASEPLRTDGPVLMVNARLLPSAGVIQRLAGLARQDRPAVFRFHDDVAAAVLGPQHKLPAADAIVGCDPASWLDPLGLDAVEADLPLLQYPHDLVRYHPAALTENLEDRLARGQYKEIADGVFAASSDGVAGVERGVAGAKRSGAPESSVPEKSAPGEHGPGASLRSAASHPGAEGATLGQYTVTDTREGPIVLESGASVGPHCYLSGPVHVGPRSRIIEHAAVKDAVALGHTCKIGGELENSIVEPYTNKQHHGFLGHSYLGSWVNLGAGTCNSDLKNTYGPVSMEYAGRKVATGMQFIGCIIGDYAKTAINTSIFTGKTIGACTMVYGFVTTNVASFVNYARLFGQVTEAPVDVMIATQARMFARRNVPQRDCDVQLLRDMYELTRHERQLAVEPLSL